MPIYVKEEKTLYMGYTYFFTGLYTGSPYYSFIQQPFKLMVVLKRFMNVLRFYNHNILQ